MTRNRLITLALTLALLAGASCSQAKPMSEPNVQTAMQWWTEIPDKLTPLGVPDHLCRFLVLFNGTILAQPSTNSRTGQYNGLGVQLGFMPSSSGDWIESGSPHYPLRDDNSVIQGWNNCAAPVLWSEWASNGRLVRQNLFAHVPGGNVVKSGDEPLFLWIRFYIRDTVDALPLEDKFGFALKINAPHIYHSMEIRNNVNFHPEISLYPRELTASSDSYDPKTGFMVMEEGNKVRVAVAPNQNCSAQFKKKNPYEADSLLSVQTDAKKTNHIDVLLPMIPTDKAIVEKELALGYDGALKEANASWSSLKPDIAAKVDTPEKHINESIKHSIRYGQLIADRDPKNGSYGLLTGAWIYAELWATPNAVVNIMNFDTMGYHSTVEKYLKIFKDEQGTTTPNGKGWTIHPGFYSLKSRPAVGWLSDHGAVLYTACEHALISGNQGFIKEWTPSIVKACEFIKDTRHIAGHGGIEGLLPPAQATDNATFVQSVWSDGWSYKGLITAVKFLRKTKHPRAEEFAAEAAAYKKAFVTAFHKKWLTMPTWKDSKGKLHHFVPGFFSGEANWETRGAFYLDTGPLCLVFLELLDANDPAMQSTLAWFREGPQRKLYRFDSQCWQTPSLIHEISSCEPGYSWNIFHSWQSGDKEKYLEGMYSQFVGAISRQTYTICETRGGVSATGPWMPTPYLARLAMIDEMVTPGELHLLRLAPLAWITTNKETAFENMPTELGPVTLKVKLADGGKELKVTYSARFRETPKRVILHVPPVDGLKKITLNCKPLKWDGRTEIRL